MRISDWSSDVCSSDLAQRIEIGSDHAQRDRRLDRWAILEFLDDDLGAGDRVEASAQAVQKQGRALSVINLELQAYFRIVRRVIPRDHVVLYAPIAMPEFHTSIFHLGTDLDQRSFS